MRWLPPGKRIVIVLLVLLNERMFFPLVHGRFRGAKPIAIPLVTEDQDTGGLHRSSVAQTSHQVLLWYMHERQFNTAHRDVQEPSSRFLRGLPLGRGSGG